MFGICEPLRDIRKVHSKSQDRLVVWKSHWERFEWACELHRVESQGINRVGQMVLVRLMETQM